MTTLFEVETKRALAAIQAFVAKCAETRGRADAERDAMMRALGYTWVHDHLGEFCNLHQRDLPGYRHAAEIEPGKFSFSGFFQPVTAAQLAARITAAETRSAELIEWFLTPGVVRFRRGFPARFDCEGFRDKLVRFYRGRLLIDVYEKEQFAWAPFETHHMTAREAGTWFDEKAAQGEWHFIANDH